MTQYQELLNVLKSGDPLETLRSAQVNFENIERQNPLILKHPVWMIAKAQLDAGILALSGQDSETKDV